MDHKELEVWKQGMDLAEMVYLASKDFPREEMYGLTSQIRRSAVSVVSNIAEGAARRSDREFLQFLYIALGSLAEMETQLILAQRLKYLHTTQKVAESLISVRRMLTGLITHLKQKEHHHG